jgi:16S rRNA (guanine527-N7)-methyltransferase
LKDRLAPLEEALRVIQGRRLSQGERAAFGRYLDLLVRWNRTHDLTACRTEAEVVTGLFRDSLLFLRVLGPLVDRPAVRVVDIGAGAGIPGLPLRLVLPSLRLTLIEARRKRVSFLRAALRELGLAAVEAREGRADMIANEDSEIIEKFDIVLGRGISPDELLAAALPYLRPGGTLIAGGPPRVMEVPAAPGYSDVEWRRERFPELGLGRTFLVARK